MRRPNRPAVKNNGIKVVVFNPNHKESKKEDEVLHQESSVEEEKAEAEAPNMEEVHVSEEEVEHEKNEFAEEQKNDADPPEDEIHTEESEEEIETSEGVEETIPKEEENSFQDTSTSHQQPRGSNGRFISKGNGSGKEPKKKGGPKVGSSFIPSGEGTEQ